MGRKPRITNNEENVHIETSSNRHQKKNTMPIYIPLSCTSMKHGLWHIDKTYFMTFKPKILKKINEPKLDLNNGKYK